MSETAYIHQTVAGEAGGPLLFVLHGTGGDERQLLPLGREVLPAATVVSPRGDVSEGGAARFFRRAAEGVYDMDDLARATAKMAGFVRAVAEGRGGPALAGLGYSNGANILASVVFAEPGLFDRVVLMHPLIPFEPLIAGSLEGKKILVTAGRRDPICPPNLTARLEAHLRDRGADVIVHWHEGGHEVRQDEIDAAREFLAPLSGAGGKGANRMADTGEIRLEESAGKGRYFVTAPGGATAEMTFSKAGAHQIIIDHTEVPDAFRGQGVGLLLVTRAVEDARRAGKTIIPLCPFAAAQFRRHPEWADVLKR